MRLQKVLISPNLTLILWAWQGGVAKIKVAYMMMRIPVVCMTCTCHAPFGSDDKKLDLFLCIFRFSQIIHSFIYCYT